MLAGRPTGSGGAGTASCFQIGSGARCGVQPRPNALDSSLAGLPASQPLTCMLSPRILPAGSAVRWAQRRCRGSGAACSLSGGSLSPHRCGARQRMGGTAAAMAPCAREDARGRADGCAACLAHSEGGCPHYTLPGPYGSLQWPTVATAVTLAGDLPHAQQRERSTFLPSYLPTCLPAYLPTSLPPYLPTFLPAKHPSFPLATHPSCHPAFLNWKHVLVWTHMHMAAWVAGAPEQQRVARPLRGECAAAVRCRAASGD